METARVKVTKYGAVAYGLAIAAVVLDQLVKQWIVYGLLLPARESVPVAGPLYFTMVWNRSVSFGLVPASHDLVRWLLTLFSLGVALALAWWARSANRPLIGLGLGLIMGGAVGNAIDRIRFGAVVDFFDVTRIGFFPWVFNVADSAITVGVICLLLDSIRREPQAA